jgi:hypothetical protein
MPSIRLTLVACAGAALLIGGLARGAHAQGSSGTDLAHDVTIATQSGQHATADDVDTAAEKDIDDGAVSDVEVEDGAQDATDTADSTPATPEPADASDTPDTKADGTSAAAATPEPGDKSGDTGTKGDSTPEASPAA